MSVGLCHSIQTHTVLVCACVCVHRDNELRRDIYKNSTTKKCSAHIRTHCAATYLDSFHFQCHSRQIYTHACVYLCVCVSRARKALVLFSFSPIAHTAHTLPAAAREQPCRERERDLGVRALAQPKANEAACRTWPNEQRQQQQKQSARHGVERRERTMRCTACACVCVCVCMCVCSPKMAEKSSRIKAKAAQTAKKHNEICALQVFFSYLRCVCCFHLVRAEFLFVFVVPPFSCICFCLFCTRSKKSNTKRIQNIQNKLVLDSFVFCLPLLLLLLLLLLLCVLLFAHVRV